MSDKLSYLECCGSVAQPIEVEQETRGSTFSAPSFSPSVGDMDRAGVPVSERGSHIYSSTEFKEYGSASGGTLTESHSYVTTSTYSYNSQLELYQLSYRTTGTHNSSAPSFSTSFVTDSLNNPTGVQTTTYTNGNPSSTTNYYNDARIYSGFGYTTDYNYRTASYDSSSFTVLQDMTISNGSAFQETVYNGLITADYIAGELDSSIASESFSGGVVSSLDVYNEVYVNTNQGTSAHLTESRIRFSPGGSSGSTWGEYEVQWYKETINAADSGDVVLESLYTEVVTRSGAFTAWLDIPASLYSNGYYVRVHGRVLRYKNYHSAPWVVVNQPV